MEKDLLNATKLAFFEKKTKEIFPSNRKDHKNVLVPFLTLGGAKCQQNIKLMEKDLLKAAK